MARTDLQTAARHHTAKLGTGYVTGTILVAAVNRAARKLNADCKMNKTDMAVGLTAGNREVTLSGSIMDVYRVRSGTGTNRKRLGPTDVHALDRAEGDWEAATAGEPTRYYLDGMVIGFEPKPYRASNVVAGTRYATASYIAPTAINDHIYKVVTAGTYRNLPTWPTTEGGHGTAGTNIAFQEYGPSRAHLRVLKDPGDFAFATSSPSWCPSRYHDTIAKGAAIDLAGGFDADAENSAVRTTRLYQEYLQEVAELRRLSTNRSKEYTARLAPMGYGTFRR